MHSHIRAVFIIAAAASLMSSAALSQEAQLQPSYAMGTTATTTKWMTQEAAGQWRTSKMIGLNVFNNSNEKIGDIAELIIDRSGKLEAVVVGVGGFLGLGEHDVAVPYSQINWIYQPVALSSTSTTPTTSGAASPASRNESSPALDPAERVHAERALQDHATIVANRNASYPNHAVLNMTKDQLKAAPAFKFSR
jgi:sporulation protein YlmC with PRC-barrel domain